MPGPLDFTLASLLTWTSLTPELVPVAVPKAGSKPSQPTALQTSIEAPWSVILSPGPNGRWHHSATPNTHTTITELWQTRLGTATAEPPVVHPPVPAVWTPGYPSNPPQDPFTMALTPTQRTDIVTLTSGGTGPTGGPIAGVAIPADLMMLTPLGAWLDLSGSWTPAGLSLVGWVQRSTAGRDSYVKTVTAGFLFPTGHKAVRVTITDREFWVDTSGDVVANLIQNTYVDVVQPVVNYPHSAQPNDGRQNPFSSVKITTKATPSLDVDALVDPLITVSGFTTDQAIFVRSAGQDVQFTHVATDVEGRQAHFTTGAIWVDEAALGSVVGAVSSLIADYGSVDPSRITPNLDGQLLAFAEPVKTGPGKTALHVDTYELGGVASSVPSVLPGYFPVMTTATVRLPAAEQMTGSSLSAPLVTYDPDYLTSGFAPGFPEVYLDVVSGGPPCPFRARTPAGRPSPTSTSVRSPVTPGRRAAIRTTSGVARSTRPTSSRPATGPCSSERSRSPTSSRPSSRAGRRRRGRRPSCIPFSSTRRTTTPSHRQPSRPPLTGRRR